MMQLTRELRVRLTDTAAAYAQKSVNTWSGWPAIAQIAPFVIIRATVEGPVDNSTGYVCDVKAIDQSLREAIAHSVERQGPQTSHVEFLKRIWQQLVAEATLPAPLTTLEVAYSPYLRLRQTREFSTMVSITQQYEFSAAHRLHCGALSDEENQALFGKCNNASGHGHNYVLEVCLESEPDSSGNVFSLAEMDHIVRRRVIDRFDHKHLNEDTEEFNQRNPTVENIATVIFGLLEDQFAPARLAGVRLYETPKTWADVMASSRAN